MPTVETNGVEAYYERHGEGPPVICAPGGGLDHRSWYPLIQSLGDEFELIPYDPRGHGKTGHGDVDDVTMELLVSDLDALIEHLELDRPAIAGCSLGGLIAHVHAASGSTDVGALVTLEAPARMSERPLMLRIMQRVQTTGARFVGMDRAWGLVQRVRNLLGNEDEWADEELPGVDMTKRAYMNDAVSQMSSEVAMQMGSVLQYEPENLSDISAPTLVLTGEDPAEFFADAAETLTRQIPNSRRDRVPNAGHTAYMDNPEAFGGIVREFLLDCSWSAVDDES